VVAVSCLAGKVRRRSRVEEKKKLVTAGEIGLVFQRGQKPGRQPFHCVGCGTVGAVGNMGAAGNIGEDGASLVTV